MHSSSASAPVTGSATVASSSHTDGSDEGFQSVLASYAPAHAVDPVKAAPQKTAPSSVAKSGKPVERDRSADATPVAKKESRADAQSGRKQKQSDSKTDPAVSPAPQTQAVPVAAVIRGGTAAQQTGDDIGDDEDMSEIQAAALNPASVQKADPLAVPNVVPANDQDTPAANVKPVNALPKPVVDEIVAAAKEQSAQPAPNVTLPSAPSNTPNIAAMLNAARGTITVATAPKVTAPKSDAKPVDAPQVASKNTAVAPDVTQAQPDANTKLMPDDRQTKPDVAQDKSGAVADNAVPTLSADQPAPTVSQPAAPAAPTTPIIAAVTPNAVNATAPANVAAQSPKTPADDAVAPNVAALATAIAVKSAAGTKTFDIRMDPPELGRVDVHLSVDRDGKVQALLSADRPQTLELLQRSSQNLEQALKDSGLNLSNNSLNFSLKGEERQGDGSGASMARARALPDAVLARAEAANASVSNMNYASGDGRLDIRV